MRSRGNSPYIRSSSPTGGLLPFRFGPSEWLGALGDLGSFVPIYLSLVALSGMPPVRTLLLVGLFYIGTALYFRLPIPVQPLKAMAAIAIAEGFGVPMLSAAGIWMGVLLLVLTWTGKIEWISRYFSKTIVGGIQLGVGLLLIKSGLNLVGSDAHPDIRDLPVPVSAFPDLVTFFSALWLLVIPQIPVTLGNAIFATSDAARVYFDEGAKRATPRNLALSIGLSDLTAGCMGALPVCHGSGGMTAHYRFGARTGGSTIIMGGIYVLAAILLALTGQSLLRFIPPWLLGVMLLYVGIHHSLLVRGLSSGRTLAWGMGILGILTGNLFYSLAAGLVVGWIGRWRQARQIKVFFF